MSSPRLITVSRAARLVGVSRGKLQKQIQDGEILSFEGMVDLDALAHAYPQVELEDNQMLEKIEDIVEKALHRARGDKLRKLLAPDLGTLAARVASLSKELSRTKKQNNMLIELVEHTRDRLSELASQSDQPEALRQLGEQLAQALRQPVTMDETDQLQLRDTVLRIMAAQVHLVPSGHDFFVEGNTSILEAGLGAGYALNYGCSNGNCGKCKARLISGEVRKIRQHDFVIPEAEKNQGYILACSHTAITDIVLEAEEAGSANEIPLQKISARVKKVDRINDQLAVLNLRTPRTNRLRFLAGQTVSLSGIGIEAAEYHIASCPCDDMNLQFHICRDADTPFAEHVFHGIQASESITIEGPHGQFVLDDALQRPVLFLAFDTGFAPVKSLIEHALTLDANGFLHLYWFHQSGGKPYLHNQARAWSDAFDNFRYSPLKLASPQPEAVTVALQQLHEDYPALDEFDIYACGTATQMEPVKEFLMAQGVPEKRVRLESL
ncbi:MAG TPA: 2Fe-2S iron-sulfur cluster binding domain-containing protein [Chromatiales bacterium]|nr:2Fe-2S iron-sulfur cluster binding domain-containing protein [Chromatiales bacterium]